MLLDNLEDMFLFVGRPLQKTDDIIFIQSW